MQEDSFIRPVTPAAIAGTAQFEGDLAAFTLIESSQKAKPRVSGGAARTHLNVDRSWLVIAAGAVCPNPPQRFKGLKAR